MLMFGSWWKLGMDATLLAMESQQVIALRLAKLATGGAAAQAEATAAAIPIAAATRSKPAQSMSGTKNGPVRTFSNAPNSTLRPNQTARLAMTPTTAAVIAVNAAESALLPRSASM